MAIQKRNSEMVGLLKADFVSHKYYEMSAMRPVHNVMGFGAEADGVTDDYQPFADTDDVALAAGELAYAPPGNYEIASPITLDANWFTAPGVTFTNVTPTFTARYELGLGSGGAVDHGSLAGLGDDDHTQYLLADGSRNLSGNLGVDVGVTIDGIDISAHAADADIHVDHTTVSITGGTGLSGGGTIDSNQTINLGTPGTLSVSSGNAATTPHTHAITTSSDPGASASILATSVAGLLQLNSLYSSGGAIQSDNYVSEATGWQITYGGDADFRNMYADELRVSAFIADLEQALSGGQIVSKSVALLSRDFTVPATSGTGTFYVEDLPGAPNTAAFTSGDWIRLRVVDRTGGLTVTDVWGTVTSYADLADGEQSWTFTCQDDGGVSGSVVYAGAVALDYGSSGDGYWEVTALDSDGPYSQIQTWATDPSVAGNHTLKTRLGNLAGVTDTDLNPSGYGLYSDNAFLKGALSVGGGVVTLDSNGITIEQGVNEVNEVRWSNFTHANFYSAIYGAEIGVGGSEYPLVEVIAVNSDESGSGDAEARLTATVGISGAEFGMVVTATSTIAGTVNINATTIGLGGRTSVGNSDFSVDTDTLYVDASTDEVGINTSSPSQALDVVGNAEINGSLLVYQTAYHLRLFESDNSNQEWRIGVNGNEFNIWEDTTNRFTIESGGQVGIGTQNPSQKLDVVGNVEVNGTFYVYAANSHIRLLESDNSNQEWRVGVDGNQFNVREDATVRFQIESGGAVGIGTTSPGYRMHVYQNQASTFAAHIQNDGNASNRWGLQIQCCEDVNPSSYYIWMIDGDGSTGVGNIQGDSAGGVDYNTASDGRYKEDIREVTGSLDTIRQLRGVSYRGRGTSPGSRRQVGFVAQELAPYVPEAVSEGSSGKMFVAPMRLIPHLVNAIKELEARLAALET